LLLATFDIAAAVFSYRQQVSGTRSFFFGFRPWFWRKMSGNTRMFIPSISTM